MSQTAYQVLRWADAHDAEIVTSLVAKLLHEISERMEGRHFDVEPGAMLHAARRWLEHGHYIALLAYEEGRPVGVATLVQTFALYAGGPIGILQEFYVEDGARGQGLGAMMMERVHEMAERRGWVALELCTPPLPQFERALSFYQRHAFQAVGGRKMRRMV